MNLKEEAKASTALLKGKTIVRVRRLRKKEVLIECEDGTRFFIHSVEGALDLSITMPEDPGLEPDHSF